MPPTESKHEDPIAPGPDFDYKPFKVSKIKQMPHVLTFPFLLAFAHVTTTWVVIL